MTSPVAITHADDGRLFVAEQTGRVRIVSGSQVLLTPFLDLSALVSVDSERGLLGIAMHPSFSTSPYMYVDYTNTSGSIVIARYRVSAANANVADPASAVVMLTIPHPTYPNHNGGQLAFGPDGKLYVGVGDGGGAGDPGNNAQHLSTLLGKVLRLDVDATPPYVAAGNPFIGVSGARDEIWAYGLRNPWKFSFDRLTGDLLIGDVGQYAWEEVDFQPTSSAGGENYGWRRMEGTHCFNPTTACDPGGLVAPILEYSHDAGDCAIIGGVRYSGAIPSFGGTYLYGDYCTGRIWGASEDVGGSWSSDLLIDSPYYISAFGEDELGEVYVSDVVGGGIYKIVPASVGGVAEEPAAIQLNATAGRRASSDRAYATGGLALTLAMVVSFAAWRGVRTRRAA